MLRIFCILSIWVFIMPLQPHAAETHRQRAELLTRYIQERYWDKSEKTYLDAWPRPDEGLPYSAMWGLGIEFSALVAGVRHDPDTYRPWMDAFFEGLEDYMNPREGLYSAYLGGTEDIYYDDNHWMVLDYIEAYEVTRSDRYLAKATAIADACLKGIDDVYGGGSYWHMDTQKYPTKNTCANAPLATALLRLSRMVKDPAKARLYATRGKAVVLWLQKTLQGKDGLMWDNVNIKTGEKNREWTFTYNTALMIQAHLEWYRIERNRSQLDEAVRLSKASSFWLRKNSTMAGDHRYSDPAYFTVHLVEAQLLVYDVTKDPELLTICRRTADFYWRTWRQGGPQIRLINISAVARMQWLLVRYERRSMARQARRFVRVELPEKGTLTLAEVEIFSGDRNIARKGRALQSSNHKDCYANLAIDGNTDGRSAARSLARSGEDEDHPWWEVEISPRYKIDRIRIWTHTDGIQGVRVLILDETRKPTWQGQQSGSHLDFSL